MQNQKNQLLSVMQQINGLHVNSGTSGNGSVRADGGIYVTPSGIPYDEMQEEQLVFIDNNRKYYGKYLPSSEWNFHYDLLEARSDIDAVLHTHAPYCTVLACAKQPIPSFHYMVGIAGVPEIPCCDYATFGTKELSNHVLSEIGQSNAILLANHGVITCGKTIQQALNVLVEVEHLAQVYIQLLSMDKVNLLSEQDMSIVLRKFKAYGNQNVAPDLPEEDRIIYPEFGGEKRD